MKAHNLRVALPVIIYRKNLLTVGLRYDILFDKQKKKRLRREIVHVYLISERGCVVRTLMKKIWKASWSSGVNKVASDGKFHREKECSIRC